MNNAQKIQFLLHAPWSIFLEPGEAGDYIVLRIKELPEFLVTGRPGKELEAEFWNALESLFESYLDAGETPPLPERFVATWRSIEEKYNTSDQPRVDGVEVESRGDLWGSAERYDGMAFA